MTRIEQPHHSIRWRRGEPSIEWGNAQSPRAPGARSSSGAQRGCVPAAAVSVLYCVTRHTPGTPSTLYTTTLPAAASWLSCVAPPSYAPTVPRGCAGVGRAHQSRDRSVPAPRTVRLVHLPAFLARLFLQYNKSSYDTHSVAARPLGARRRARGGPTRRAPSMGLGYWGEPTRGGHGPRPTSRALVPPAAPARTTPGRAEGRGRRGALGPSTCRASTAQDDRRPDRGAGGRCRATGSRAAPDTPTRASFTNAQAYDERYSERLVAGG
jgi:hypothetical protein